jgi:hypothetical protein
MSVLAAVLAAVHTAAAAVCRLFLREALPAGMEAVYGLTINALQLVIVLARVHGAWAALRKVDNRVVRTAEEWRGRDHTTPYVLFRSLCV